jgi:hypothetical protein
MCQKCELDPAKDTMVLDAKNMDDIVHNIAAMAKMKCSNNGCTRVASYQDIHNHMMTCSHGPCACTEPSCNFAAPLTALVFHLAAAHSVQVHRFAICRVQRVPGAGAHGGSSLLAITANHR